MTGSDDGPDGRHGSGGDAARQRRRRTGRQIVTACLAAKYHDPLTVGVGAVLGLWVVGALVIIGDRHLLRLIPFSRIVRIAAAVTAILAVASLVKTPPPADQPVAAFRAGAVS
ncbi:MAG: TMEM165/GDT1 family protein [Pseudonocardiaceae bacterium]